MFGLSAFDLNKIAGAVLASALLIMGLGIVSDMLFHSEAPEEPALAINMPEGEGHGGAATAEAAAPAVSLATLMASADPAKGESAAKACGACHSFDKGGPNKVGPHLWGVVDREIASVSDFSYSDALKSKSAEKWTFENLNHFITKPKDFAPGTKMGYGGMKDDAKRADLLAYLRTLSNSPTPLPTE